MKFKDVIWLGLSIICLVGLILFLCHPFQNLVGESIEANELIITTFEMGGTYKVGVTDVLKEKGKEDLYVVAFCPNIPQADLSDPSFCLNMTKELYDKKIGEGNNVANVSKYFLIISCPTSRFWLDSTKCGYSNEFQRYSILGEESFTKENSAEMVSQTIAEFNKNLAEKEPGHRLYSYYQEPLDWYK